MYTEQHHPTTQKVEGRYMGRQTCCHNLHQNIRVQCSFDDTALECQQSPPVRPLEAVLSLNECVVMDREGLCLPASYHWMKQGRGRANERVETKSAISSHNIAEISNDNDTIPHLAHCTYTYCLAEIKSFHNPAILSLRLLPNSPFQLTVTIIPLHLPSLKPLHSVILNLSYLV